MTSRDAPHACACRRAHRKPEGAELWRGREVHGILLKVESVLSRVKIVGVGAALGVADGAHERNTLEAAAAIPRSQLIVAAQSRVAQLFPQSRCGHSRCVPRFRSGNAERARRAGYLALQQGSRQGQRGKTGYAEVTTCEEVCRVQQGAGTIKTQAKASEISVEVYPDS